MLDIKKEIYLDYHATTPVLPEVLEAMSPFFVNHFGNANSTHQWGWKAEMALMKSSKQVADLVKAKASQVYFTSGATESLHWAIVGWARKNKKGRILTTSTEHKATYGACDWAKELGLDIVILDVNQYGQVNLEQLEEELKDSRPTLFSFIYGNNEIGTLNPINEISALKKKYKNLMIHTDAAQCVAKVPINFTELDVDYLSFSGHKLYGPKGIGVLLIKDPDTILPLFCGGGQQRGMRAGTIDVPSVVGLGVACEWAQINMEKECLRLKTLRDQTISKLMETQLVKLNGHPTERLPNNLNFTFSNITMDKLLLKLPKVGFSASSACSSGDTKISHVLKAIGRTDQEARQSIRLGMGYGTTVEDMEFVGNKIIEVLNEAKNFHS
jgi:cysteine desulfurase